MGAIKHRDIWTALTSRYANKPSSPVRPGDIAGLDLSNGNGFIDRWATADNTQDTDVIGLDSYNRHMIGGAYEHPLRVPITFNLQANASQATAYRFFVADQPYEIRGIACQFDTADGAANTGYITKEVAGQAPGAGVSVQTGTFNLNSTANVVQTATLASPRNLPGVFGPQESVIALNTGEMLTFNIASAVTNLAGLNVTVIALPANSLPPATVALNANSAIATQAFFLANRPVLVTGITLQNVTPTSSTGTIGVTKDTGTTAPGGGTALFTAVNPVAANVPANTPTAATLTATAAQLTMAAGDRLSLKVTGTITALAGLVVTVSFANHSSVDFVLGNCIAGATQLMFVAPAFAAAGTNAGFFIADRDYRVDDVSFIWSTAGTTGDVTVSVDGSTVASGGGTSVLSDNTNAGPSYAATANTVVVGTLAVSKRTIMLPAGSRLSIKYTTTTLGGLAGVLAAVSLTPQ